MSTKSYKMPEEPAMTVEEPAVGYGRPAAMYRTTASRLGILGEDEKKSGWLNENYESLMSEADRKFGKKERMTPDEYFGKLRHIVNAYYDNVQGQH